MPKRLILTWHGRFFSSYTAALFRFHARRWGADLIALNETSIREATTPFEQAMRRVKLRTGCTRAKMYRILAIYHQLHRYDEVLWMDESCVARVDCENLFEEYPGCAVAGFNAASLGVSFASHVTDRAIVAQQKGFALDLQRYVSMCVVLCRRSLLDTVLTAEKIIAHADLFETTSVDEALFNYLIQSSSSSPAAAAPLTTLMHRRHNVILINCGYDKRGRQTTPKDVPLSYLASEQNRIFNVSSFYEHRDELLRHIAGHMVAAGAVVEIVHEEEEEDEGRPGVGDAFGIMLAIHNCMHGLGIKARQIIVRSSRQRPPTATTSRRRFWPTIEDSDEIRWEQQHMDDKEESGHSHSKRLPTHRMRSGWVVDWQRARKEVVPLEEARVAEAEEEHAERQERAEQERGCSAAVYTVCTGTYEGDRLLLTRDGRSDDVAAYLITDNWEFYTRHRHKLTAYFVHPCWTPKRLQRTIKHLPQLFLPDHIQRSVYVDGNVLFSAADAVARLDMWKECFADRAMVCYGHFARSNPVEEGRAVVEQRLEREDKVSAVLGRLRASLGEVDGGGPGIGIEDVGLTETNVLLRDHGDGRLLEACLQIAELIKVCIRDQVVFDACMHLSGVRFERLPYPQKCVFTLAHVDTHTRRLG